MCLSHVPCSVGLCCDVSRAPGSAGDTLRRGLHSTGDLCPHRPLTRSWPWATQSASPGPGSSGASQAPDQRGREAWGPVALERLSSGTGQSTRDCGQARPLGGLQADGQLGEDACPQWTRAGPPPPREGIQCSPCAVPRPGTTAGPHEVLSAGWWQPGHNCLRVLVRLAGLLPSAPLQGLAGDCVVAVTVTLRWLRATSWPAPPGLQPGFRCRRGQVPCLLGAELKCRARGWFTGGADV